FLGDPQLKATEPLLHERVPKAAAPVYPHAGEAAAGRPPAEEQQATLRVFTDPSLVVPEVHLLSNGRYHVMISAAGGGYSRWRDLAVTRWREDTTRDSYGTFIYLGDTETGEYWSTTFNPTMRLGRHNEAIFTQARAEFRRRDHGIECYIEVCVSPEDDVEIRRVRLRNRSGRTRTIQVTTYAEVVIASQAADTAHPAFSNLFVQTELIPERGAILATRRARSVLEKPPWMLHLMTVQGNSGGKPSFETERSAFVGRGRSLLAPAAITDRHARLGDSRGSVLDPIVAVRRTIRLEPDESAQVTVVTGMAEARADAVTLAEKYQDPRLADRAFEMAFTHSQVLLQQLNATEADAQDFGRLAGAVVYPAALRRADPALIASNTKGQSGLWGYGISGDLPIVLLRVGDAEKLDLLRETVRAHAY